MRWCSGPLETLTRDGHVVGYIKRAVIDLRKPGLQQALRLDKPHTCLLCLISWHSYPRGYDAKYADGELIIDCPQCHGLVVRAMRIPKPRQ